VLQFVISFANTKAKNSVVCLDSFSLDGFALKASHKKNSLKRQDGLSASLALFHKSHTTRKCLLEIWEGGFFSSQ
jgi:hypothetical protein